MKARKLARQVAAKGQLAKGEESWDEFLKRLESDLDMPHRIRSGNARPRSEEIPSAFEEDDDEVLIMEDDIDEEWRLPDICLLYTSPSPRD